MTRDVQTWTDFAEALAFVGNSLLEPMNQTGAVGLEPDFWDDFPHFDDESVATALASLKRYARGAQAFAAEGGNPVQRASVEFTKLFVGPPRPAAAPWETMHRPGSEGSRAGFGQATFEMRTLLREAGLRVSHENNQYADHIGIELLFSSMLCSRIADADEPVQVELIAQLERFLQDHPRSWIGRLLEAVQIASPDGYIASQLALGQALLDAI